jgi:4-amino-4-deoxy-L-arabinose transferase-like glycosyltransferase
VTRADRRALLWVVGGAAVMVGVDLGRRILTTNDEARFPLLAQDILTRGDWLFPVLNGTVYHNKPILLAWLITLVSWPVGYVTQFTAVIRRRRRRCAVRWPRTRSSPGSAPRRASTRR